MVLEEGDIVLCTVEKIVGTVVVVKIDKENQEANIVFSEIAPGRIRNIRDYVVPKKRIACKVLRIKNGNIDLSLRRVTQKEKKEALETENQEKSYSSILKSVLKEKAEEIIKQIDDLSEFLKEAKTDSKKLEKLVGKEDCENILKILNSQKSKKSVVKKTISLTSTAPNGLEIIKNLFRNLKDIKVKYLSAGNYSLEKESDNPKEADNSLREFISELESKSKAENFSLVVKS